MDRAILEQNEPLDTDDQELIISLLSLENDATLKIYRKWLVGSILVEIPPLLILSRAMAPTALLKVFLAAVIVLLGVLTLLNTVFDVNAVSKTFPSNIRRIADKFMTFEGVSIINGILLAQMVYVVFGRVQLGWKGMFVVVPVGNLATLVLLRTWHAGVAHELSNLHGLKYKYKSV